MATQSALNLTLADYASRLDPSGEISTIVEMLNQVNEILQDMPFIPGNLETGHRYTARVGLPTVYYRQINQAVSPSKSLTSQVTEQCAMVRGYSQVDSTELALATDKAGLRMSEAAPFMEALSQKFANKLFYGNANVTAEEFTGLSARYSLSTAGNGANIVQVGSTIGGGGTGSNNTSIWLIGWSEKTIAGIFPKNTQAGILHKDLGERLVFGANGMGGGMLTAFVDQWDWHHGLMTKDWRYAVRIPNLNVAGLVNDSGVQISDLMLRAMDKLPTLTGVRPVFYMNRTARTALRRQQRADVKGGGQLNYDVVAGKPVYDFQGIPIRTVDQLAITEAQVF